MESRLQAIEDRLEIQALAARFSDAVNERDIDAFSMLWASGTPDGISESLCNSEPRAWKRS
jgi:hypothetical protein